MVKTKTILFSYLFHFLNVVILVKSQTRKFSCEIRPTQADTTKKLKDLRIQLADQNLLGYVIFSEDEHQSEDVQLYDERRAWITGFSGSTGTAVVTRDSAALWTDGRYWTQAADELDCRNWLLMRDGEQNVPSIGEWLSSKVDAGLPSNHIGVAAQFVSAEWWSEVNAILHENNATLIEVVELIDLIWKPPDRPLPELNPVKIHPIEYAGMSWKNKVKMIAEEIKVKNVNSYVVTALDEIAWLLNIRGSDIPFNPFFKAYAMIFDNEDVYLWMNKTQLTSDAVQQLNNIKVESYSSFLINFTQIVNKNATSTVWVPPSAAQAIINRIFNGKMLILDSPIERIKAIKNPIEQKGMRDCGIRDSVARLRHIVWLEDQLNNNRHINETEAAEQLNVFQKQEDLFDMSSFETISAFGPNAAVIHYSPKPKTAAQITKNGLYLLDAGGQYLDCTTDITRTHTFGIANDEQKIAYTLVLQGSIDLADAIFPTGTYGRQIDILARQSLYKHSMNYNHGTGHGIGHYLAVHEGPSSISTRYKSGDQPLADGMVFSDEPGFYLPEKYGIRLESDIIVKNHVFENNYINSTVQYLHFEMLTFVPFERNLINCKMLTHNQLQWLNSYHENVRLKLEETGRLNSNELRYLRDKTDEIRC